MRRTRSTAGRRVHARTACRSRGRGGRSTQRDTDLQYTRRRRVRGHPLFEGDPERRSPTTMVPYGRGIYPRPGRRDSVAQTSERQTRSTASHHEGRQTAGTSNWQSATSSTALRSGDTSENTINNNHLSKTGHDSTTAPGVHPASRNLVTNKGVTENKTGSARGEALAESRDEGGAARGSASLAAPLCPARRRAEWLAAAQSVHTVRFGRRSRPVRRLVPNRVSRCYARLRPRNRLAVPFRPVHTD